MAIGIFNAINPQVFKASPVLFLVNKPLIIITKNTIKFTIIVINTKANANPKLIRSSPKNR
jgi:hypothetical protein